MTVSESRTQAWKLCESLGLPANPNLPPLEPDLALRDKLEIGQRALCLMACVAASYGFPREQALAWLSAQKLTAALSPEESDFLASGEGTDHFQAQVEALFAFAWLLGSYQSINWRQPTPDNLVHTFPDLKKAEAAAPFLEKAALPPQAQVIEALDMAYCLDWAATEQHLRGKPNRLSYNIKARRHPLEWALSTESWSEVSLDT